MIRLLIADDHPVVREGLKRIIADRSDMRVAAEAADGNEALEKTKRCIIDVALLDVSMPGVGFLETLRRLKEESPDMRVLVLSIYPEDHYAIRALRAGADGYLTKDHSPAELADAIRCVYAGRQYVSDSLAEKLSSELQPAKAGISHRQLSDREYEVFHRLVSGKRIKEIAAELALSPKTVSTYRARILEKMRLNGNAELIRYAIENALLD
jgi:two-component system invasion response regulator UvrY